MNTQVKRIRTHSELIPVAKHNFASALNFLHSTDEIKNVSDKNYHQLIASIRLSVKYNNLYLTDGGLCDEDEYYSIIAEEINNHQKQVWENFVKSNSELSLAYDMGNILFTHSKSEFNCKLISVYLQDPEDRLNNKLSHLQKFEMFQESYEDLKNQTLFNLVIGDYEKYTNRRYLNPYRAFSGDDVNCFLLGKTFMPTVLQKSNYLNNLSESFYDDGVYSQGHEPLSTQVTLYRWDSQDVKNLCDISDKLYENIKSQIAANA